jgi:hypothetical protein
MAVVAVKGTIITNADAGTLNNANVFRGIVKEAAETLEVTSGDSIASVYRLNRVPSNARVSRVLLSCDAITTCAGDIGVYRTAADGGAVVDVDFFASAQSLAAALANSDVTHEADAADGGVGYGLADQTKMLWQALQFATDPRAEFDVAVTLTAAAGSAGTIGLKTQFAI